MRMPLVLLAILFSCSSLISHKVDLRVGINNRLRFSPSHFFFFYLLRRLPEVTTYGVVRHQIDLLDRENTIYSLLFLLGLRK